LVEASGQSAPRTVANSATPSGEPSRGMIASSIATAVAANSTRPGSPAFTAASR
jgi:hypothetical protein